jgi:cell division protein FtsL
MTRLNVVLLLAVLASALYLVNVQYESRRLYTEIDRAKLDARRIETEREQLQVDKRAQATPLRVDKLAREQLHMRVTTPAITHYVTYTAAQSAGAENAGVGRGAQAGGRVQ